MVGLYYSLNFFELGSVETVLSIPADYPNDIESLYHGEDFYILITHASDTGSPDYCDTVKVFKYNQVTDLPELVLSQSAPGVTDVSYFAYDGIYYVLVAQFGDGVIASTEGLFVYMWTIDQDVGSQEFLPMQRVAASGPETIDTIFAGDTQFIVASEKVHTDVVSEAAVMYEWKGGHMDEFAIFPKSNLKRVLPFCIFSRVFLGLASYADSSSNPVTSSEILLYNLHLHKFETFQELTTYGAINMAVFTFGTGLDTETFLLVANTYNDHEDKPPKSIIYKYNSDRFVPFQCLEVTDIVGWETIKDEKNLVSLVIYSATNVTVYEYDGWRFQLSRVQMDWDEIAMPVNAVSSHFSGNVADFLIASHAEYDGSTSNYFKLTFQPLNLESEFEEEAVSECQAQQEQYETIVTKHITIEKQIPDVIFKDLGEFEYTGNASFLANISAEDIVINDIRIKKGAVLTKDEEAQLARIIGIRDGNSAGLGTMETELPDTMLLTSDPQTVAGAKTFSTFAADGDVSATTLTCTTVNTVNVVTLKNTYIDTTANEVFSITFGVSGGIEVNGDLSVSGLLDGVAMSNVVTLSGDHSITGVKTFSGALTANGNFDVTGTVDTVSLTTSSVFQPTGSQTVTGSYTFAASLTANENVAVSGQVDGVDLSVLQDEAVYLDGDHDILGAMTFSGGVTMVSGLSVTEGNTVDGVDIETLDANLLRISVEQDVSAEYTFSSLLTFGSSITVEGEVDHIDVPDNVVLIDSATPVSVVGPVGFNVDVTVADLCIGYCINNVKAPIAYETLDLLLTAAPTSKNHQRVTGRITFDADISVLDNVAVEGLVDGINVSELEANSVYLTGDQTITGPKTIGGSITLSSDLTADMRVDGVNINDFDTNAIKLSDGEITATGNLKFSGNVEFQGTISTGGDHTFSPSTTLSDLVTQGTTETIGGAKTFSAITSSENVQVTSTINDVPINRLYSESIVLADATAVTVTGNWVFSDDLSLGGTLSTTGNIDGISLDNAVTLSEEQTITGPISMAAGLSASTSISVTGDVSLSGLLNGVDVAAIDADTLKCSGVQTVTGKKTFDTLTVQDNLVITGTIDDVDVSYVNDNAVFVTGNQNIAGVKTFQAATTFSDVVFNGLVDGISLPSFFTDVLTQGTTQTVVGQVDFSANVIIETNLNVADNINGYVVEYMWANSAKLTDTTYSVQLHFGSVESNDDISVSGTVDGVMINRDAVLADKEGQVVTGKKTFKTDVSFGEDVAVTVVNGVDILDLSQNAVKNTGTQSITTGKTFTGGITINDDLTVTGTVDGVDVSDLASRAVVTSSAVENAVQTVTAAVTLSTVTAEQDVLYTGTLQSVNIQTLNSAYFSRTASSQTITGDKRYTGLVTVATGGTLDVDSLVLDGTLESEDMDAFYQAVWTNGAGDTVYGVKTFQECVTIEGNLDVDGTVDGVDISGDAMVSNQGNLITGFKTFSADLTIDSQNLDFDNNIQIDGVDVSVWDSDAVRKGSNYVVVPALTFEDVHFSGDVTVTGSCNDNTFSPATYMTKSRDQDVTAVKTFQYGVDFAGNLQVSGTVQGADVVQIETTSLLVSGEQTIEGALTLQGSPTFSDITTTGLIDGEDVVDLYLLTHRTPAIKDFESFLEGQCDLLDEMHDAFSNQAYILRYPERVQTIRTNGRAKWKGTYYGSTQWLVEARAKYNMDHVDQVCRDTIIYQWNDQLLRYETFKTLTLDFAEDVAFFDMGGWLFLAVITSNASKSCEVVNLLPANEQPSRSADFQLDVIPEEFEDITDRVILIYIWSPSLEEFLVYQRLAGVGSASVDSYVDPLLSRPCLAIANHRSASEDGVTTEVQSAVYCMESVNLGFNHVALIETLGAIKIHPFLYDGILHLAVANRLDTAGRTFLVESAIWGNFVKEVVITTSAAADVSVAEFHGQYFVAFANEFEGQLEWEDYDVPITVYSYVYNAEGESTVDLQQEIAAFRVQSLDFFTVHDQLFLVVVNKTNSVTIFRYAGMEMFKVIHTIPLEGAANLALYPFKNDPEKIHIAAMAYGEHPVLFPGTPVTTRDMDSVILQLYFQGFQTDTIGCSSDDQL
ncbi:uncharacterized protein [Diadema setosum]|uniref:uncharacterized protein n=1 Tax=Diadema setosum TaxID=31175 RepID=UPI003B3BCE87